MIQNTVRDVSRASSAQRKGPRVQFGEFPRSFRSTDERSSRPSVGPVKQIDRMDDINVLAAFLDFAGDLQDAADVSRGDNLRTRGLNMVHLATPQPLGHLGLR